MIEWKLTNIDGEKVAGNSRDLKKKIFPISHRRRATATATRRRQIDRHRPKSTIGGIREEKIPLESRQIPVGRAENATVERGAAVAEVVGGGRLEERKT